MFRTWENLAEKVHFLLEVSMRELLVGWLHKVLAGVEEILQKRSIEMSGHRHQVKCYRNHDFAFQDPTRTPCFYIYLNYCVGVSDLDGIEAAVLPCELQQRHQCLQ